MISNKTAIFLDGNWLLHRAYHTIGKRSAIPTRRVPMQLLSWFYEYAVRWNAKHGLIAFDGDAVFRYELYDGYKASRKGKDKDTGESDEVYASLEPAKRLFCAVGVTNIQLKSYEADDVVVAAASQWCAANPSNRAIVVNKDKDAYGYVTDRLLCWTPAMTHSPEVTVNPAYVKSKYGLSASQFRDFQILIGDKIDNIPSILTVVEARDLLVEHGSLKEYFSTPSGKEFFRDKKKKLLRNKALVSMKTDCVDLSSLDIAVPRPMALDISMVVDEFGPLPKSASAYSSTAARTKTLF